MRYVAGEQIARMTLVIAAVFRNNFNGEFSDVSMQVGFLISWGPEDDLYKVTAASSL